MLELILKVNVYLSIQRKSFSCIWMIHLKNSLFLEQTHQIWHIYLHDFEPGQIYAYRVDGPFDPQNGHRFNVNKLLIDPYARAITGRLERDDALFGYNID